MGIFQASQSLGSDTSSPVALGDIDAVVAVFSSLQTNRIWLNDTSDNTDTIASALVDSDMNIAAVDTALTDDAT